MTRVPLARPSLADREHHYVLEALEASWLSGHGPHVERFEQGWSSCCGTRHAVAVASGTAALHLLLVALGVRAGDEVIVPALTYVAVANAVRHAGGIPVVADVDPATWCLSTVAARAAVTRRTVGVVAVHAYGHPADVGALSALAARHGLWLVEDGAEAHLATYHGAVVGGLARAAVFSFFANKIVSTGEGGAVTTSDTALAERVRALSRQGVAEGDDRYSPSLTGLGLRMGNLAAAVGCGQLERLGELLDRRRHVWRRYQQGLGQSSAVRAQPVRGCVTVAPWLYSVTFDEGARRDAVRRALTVNGIESRPLFPNLATLPVAAPASDRCPEAGRLAACGLSLPLYPDLQSSDVDRIVEVVGGA
ncbi:MAG TPA: DegT/DnrJ/EryC1/StrS family aminotransferase [Acidimicrobiales bacterium]|nr:DegT/DnrJ/EryC1/StrS family aminotransferase [Acidimicrobiales bacterium]